MVDVVVDWSDFEREAPALAAHGRALFDAAGVVLVGSLRGDGWPRISPVEPLIADGRLYLGMMWQSRKALDLRRDPRCTVQSAIGDKHATSGEFKVYGRAVEVFEPDERARFCRALEAAIGWSPPGDFHLFAVDIVQVGIARVIDEVLRAQSWRPGRDVVAMVGASAT
jgi:hypothetical protein